MSELDEPKSETLFAKSPSLFSGASDSLPMFLPRRAALVARRRRLVEMNTQISIKVIIIFLPPSSVNHLIPERQRGLQGENAQTRPESGYISRSSFRQDPRFDDSVDVSLFLTITTIDHSSLEHPSSAERIYSNDFHEVQTVR